MLLTFSGWRPSQPALHNLHQRQWRRLCRLRQVQWNEEIRGEEGSGRGTHGEGPLQRQEGQSYGCAYLQVEFSFLIMIE